jgi:D-alanyl-D-alanine carboxypeptidase
MLVADLEYSLRKNLRKVRSIFLRARQRGVFSKERWWRFVGAFLLTSFILGLTPAADLTVESPSPASSPAVMGITKADAPYAERTATTAGTAGQATPPAGGGQVKGESAFKQLSEKSGRGPWRIPDSPDLGEIAAKAALFVDAESGVTLWEKEPQRPLPLASTTKMMTALVAAVSLPLDEVVTVPAACAALVGTQKMGLLAGEKIRVADLLTGMLVSSAGDAACALSRQAGAEEEFVRKMNEKAQSLGMIQTRFANPVGNDELDGNGNEGTAADLLLLARAFWQNASLREMVALSEKTVVATDGQTEHKLQTTNDLLTRFPGIKGIKTGYTVKAQGCFVSFYERGGHQIFGVLLGSEDRFGETQKVLDWIFAVYRWPT